MDSRSAMASQSVTFPVKKQNIIDTGVIQENEADTAKLISLEIINQEKLFEYAHEAADLKIVTKIFLSRINLR